MRGEDRLGPLQVRVAGEDHVGIGFAARDERPLQFFEQLIDLVDRIADVELEVGGDLVVAAASGVQLASDIAELLDQPALDVHVDVFEFVAERQFAPLDLAEDLIECRLNPVRLVVGQQADGGEHAGVRFGAADVDVCQPRVKADRFGKGFHQFVGRGGETSSPGFSAHAGRLLHHRNSWFACTLGGVAAMVNLQG